MQFTYYADTDMLYLRLVDAVSAESEEVAPGIVLDYDEDDRVIGIEIEDASIHIDLGKLEISALPVVDLIFSKLPMGHCNQWLKCLDAGKFPPSECLLASPWIHTLFTLSRRCGRRVHMDLYGVK